MSPDGRSAYVASFFSSAVDVFDRDTATGALVQKAGAAGCIADTPTAGCTDGRSLAGPRGVAVSPDGLSVYVASSAAA